MWNQLPYDIRGLNRIIKGGMFSIVVLWMFINLIKWSWFYTNLKELLKISYPLKKENTLPRHTNCEGAIIQWLSQMTRSEYAFGNGIHLHNVTSKRFQFFFLADSKRFQLVTTRGVDNMKGGNIDASLLNWKSQIKLVMHHHQIIYNRIKFSNDTQIFTKYTFLYPSLLRESSDTQMMFMLALLVPPSNFPLKKIIKSQTKNTKSECFLSDPWWFFLIKNWTEVLMRLTKT